MLGIAFVIVCAGGAPDDRKEAGASRHEHKYEKCYPDQLSGGEQQRTAIARALINHPPILFADEPTGNLDSKTERIVIDLLKKLAAKYETSILIVTHNEDLVKDADRVIRLEDGEIVNG